MLLTGFDAPVEQVLYLDRSTRDAELLQAVARVNRPADGKKCGYVIDYVGVTNHLTQALKAYAAEDIQGALKDLRTEIGHLGPQRDRVRLLFTGYGVTPAPSEEAIEDCVALLEDPQLRDRFEVDLKRFLSTVDIVLPLPDAGPYLADAKLFTEIALRTRRRYRIDNGDFDASLYGEKVRELIDEHLESLGVEQVLPPVSLTSADFRQVPRRSTVCGAGTDTKATRGRMWSCGAGVSAAPAPGRTRPPPRPRSVQGSPRQALNCSSPTSTTRPPIMSAAPPVMRVTHCRTTSSRAARSAPSAPAGIQLPRRRHSVPGLLSGAQWSWVNTKMPTPRFMSGVRLGP
jgi:UvrB domain 3